MQVAVNQRQLTRRHTRGTFKTALGCGVYLIISQLWLKAHRRKASSPATSSAAKPPACDRSLPDPPNSPATQQQSHLPQRYQKEELTAIVMRGTDRKENAGRKSREGEKTEWTGKMRQKEDGI